MERNERTVAAMAGIRTVDPFAPKQVRLVRAGVLAAGTVEHLADLEAAIEQLRAGRLEGRDNQVQALGGAGCRGGDGLVEDDRTTGAPRRGLEYSAVFH